VNEYACEQNVCFVTFALVLFMFSGDLEVLVWQLFAGPFGNLEIEPALKKKNQLSL
jgi:hypothetical protein